MTTELKALETTEPMDLKYVSERETLSPLKERIVEALGALDDGTLLDRQDLAKQLGVNLSTLSSAISKSEILKAYCYNAGKRKGYAWCGNLNTIAYVNEGGIQLRQQVQAPRKAKEVTYE